MAVLPWDISLSRVGFETHLALFLTAFGILLFIKAKTKAVLLIPAAVCFGLAVHTYHSYKIIVPLVLILTIWFKFVKPYEKLITFDPEPQAATLGNGPQ